VDRWRGGREVDEDICNEGEDCEDRDDEELYLVSLFYKQ
jgi:hypothetical protein